MLALCLLTFFKYLLWTLVLWSCAVLSSGHGLVYFCCCLTAWRFVFVYTCNSEQVSHLQEECLDVHSVYFESVSNNSWNKNVLIQKRHIVRRVFKLSSGNYVHNKMRFSRRLITSCVYFAVINQSSTSQYCGKENVLFLLEKLETEMCEGEKTPDRLLKVSAGLE